MFARRWTWLGVSAIVLVTLIAYAPALGAGYVWDDPEHVSGIPFQGTWTYLRWIWFRLGATPQYYPITHTTFWLEYQLWGLHPAGYHLVNVLLHIANALLVWRLLGRLDVPGAWLAAAIFALHPVHAESVAWITERKNTLSTLFYLLAASFALTAWGIAPGADPPHARDPRAIGGVRPRAYVLCLLCFVAAILSKSVTSTFPAVILLVLWWRRKRITLQTMLSLAPFFAISAAMARLTSGMEKWNVGATGSYFDLSFLRRVLIAGRAVWFYAGKLVWPARLSFIYPRWVVSPEVLQQWAFPALALAAIIALWALRRRLSRGPLVALLFFGLTLFPALGFFNVYPMRFSFVADHFQYLASVSLIAAAAAVLWRLRPTPVRAAIVAGILLPLAALTFARAQAFKDERTLWLDTLTKNPGCWLAMNSLGTQATAEGHFDEAIAWFDRSLRAFPRQHEAHIGRGQALAGKHEWDQSLREFQAAVAVDPADERILAGAEAASAQVLAARGDLEGAAREYEKALTHSPAMESSRLEYAMVLLRLHRPEQAVELYRKGLEINPDSVAIRSALSELLFQAGFVQDAMRYTAEALDLKPDARLENNYGVMLMQAGRPAEAAEQFSRAISNQPDFAEAYDGLGFVREAQGRTSEAAELYHKALALDPNSQSARNHLDHLRAQGR